MHCSHPIPSTVHQIWLGGDQGGEHPPRFNDQHWEWVLSLATVRLHLKPQEHRLYYDSAAGPPRCARAFATPVHVAPPATVGSGSETRHSVRSDVLRLQVLHAHGGVYLDVRRSALTRLLAACHA